jgi:uncharacterized membrane protein
VNVYSLYRIFLLLMVLTVAACISIPAFYPYGTFVHLDGIAGAIDHADLWMSMDPLSAIVYGMGDLFCHQEMARSFIVNGSQMPFCIRDISIFIGIIISMAAWEVMQLYVDPLSRKVLITAFILIFIMAADWAVGQHTDMSSMLLREATGILAGLGIGTLIKAYCDRSYQISMGIRR